MTSHEWYTLLGTLGIQAVVAAYSYGRTTEKVVGLREWLKKVSSTVDEHETRISKIEGALQ